VTKAMPPYRSNMVPGFVIASDFRGADRGVSLGW
jgi:hypothetical protein